MSAGRPLVNDRVRAWTLLDELVIDIIVMTRRPSGDSLAEIAAALRASAIRAALLVARGVHGENGSFHSCARSSLSELADLRYHTYLARRFGLIDARQYRGVAAREERVRRFLRELLGDVQPASDGSSPLTVPPEPSG